MVRTSRREMRPGGTCLFRTDGRDRRSGTPWGVPVVAPLARHGLWEHDEFPADQLAWRRDAATVRTLLGTSSCGLVLSAPSAPSAPSALASRRSSPRAVAMATGP